MKKILIRMGVTIVLIALVLAGLSFWSLWMLKNKATTKNVSPTMSQFSDSFKQYDMDNGLVISYPETWTALPGNNEFVVNLVSPDDKILVEASYNVLENNDRKDAEAWKVEVDSLAKNNDELGIIQSSVVVKDILEVDALVFIRKTDMSIMQIIIPVEASQNSKFIQFSLKTDEENFQTGQFILGQIVTKSLIANSLK